MARYFFNFIDGKLLVDREGTECADMHDVRTQAIHTAGCMLRDMGPDYGHGFDWQMLVTDETHTTVLKLKFSVEVPA
jgi:hypothetical protein